MNAYYFGHGLEIVIFSLDLGGVGRVVSKSFQLLAELDAAFEEQSDEVVDLS